MDFKQNLQKISRHQSTSFFLSLLNIRQAMLRIATFRSLQLQKLARIFSKPLSLLQSNERSEYFSVLIEIDLLIKRNDKLKGLLKSTQIAIHEGTNLHTYTGVPSLFAKLMENTEVNCQKQTIYRGHYKICNFPFYLLRTFFRTILYSKICLQLFVQFREMSI